MVGWCHQGSGSAWDSRLEEMGLGQEGMGEICRKGQGPSWTVAPGIGRLKLCMSKLSLCLMITLWRHTGERHRSAPFNFFIGCRWVVNLIAGPSFPYENFNPHWLQGSRRGLHAEKKHFLHLPRFKHRYSVHLGRILTCVFRFLKI
jgi:hypothetical protein